MTITDTKEIGQLFVCGFDGLEPTPGIIDLIENHNLGCVILFSRNIDSPAQVRQLTHALQEIAHKAGHTRPLLIVVDQENGVMRRLGHSATYLPGNMGLGALGSTIAARKVATATAQELLALGMNWNLAPSVDVNNNALNPVIGVRSFGENPEEVARLGMAQVIGYHLGNVATSIKHFPGHGDTATDSHLGVPVINKTKEELKKTELVPFQRIMATASSVMISHVSLPRLGTTQVSSLSPEVIKGLLRQDMGYQGLVVTDCLEMEAVRDTVGFPEAALLALKAGNDMVMISHTYDFQIRSLKRVQEAGLDLEESLARVAEFKNRFLSWDGVFADRPQLSHELLSESLYDRIPTIVRNRTNLLPIRPNIEDRILFLAAHVPPTPAIDSEKEPFNSLHSALIGRHPNVEYIIYNESSDDMSDTIRGADYVIMGTANANLHPFQVQMVQRAHDLAKERLVVVAVINPYDLMAFQDIDTYLVTYEYTPPAHEAAVRTIFGETDPTSRLPVTIPGVAAADTTPAYRIEAYTPFKHLQGVTDLWKETYGEEWPLSQAKIDLVLRGTTSNKHFVAIDLAGFVVGFVASQVVLDEGSKQRHGELMLLLVSPGERNRGIGSQLHEKVLAHLKESSNTLRLGSTVPRFFPGLPNDSITNHAFFKKRGWDIFQEPVYDLEGDLQGYEIPADIKSRIDREQIVFERIKPAQIEELYEFQKCYFPSWLGTYMRHAELGDYQDLLVARRNNVIVGSLVLNTTHISHPDRCDLIWTDDALFGEASGGMACVGVASEERGRGIGIGLVAKANELLRLRGVKKAYVDWVELVDFYRRTGYEPWRSYHTATMKL